MIPSPIQQSSPALEQVLSQLKGVRTSMHGWRACCPAHADRKPSLSIGQGEHGQVLLKCFAGCSLEHIVEAMGLTMADLFPEETPAPDGQTTPSVKTRHPTHPTLTLVDLALEKQLPWKFLFSLGVMEHPSGGLQIPYHLPDGTLAPRYRIRTALVAEEGSRWIRLRRSLPTVLTRPLQYPNKVNQLFSVCRTCCPGSYHRCAGPSQRFCLKG